MIKIEWLRLMGEWTMFGFYSAILVEGGVGGTSKILGRKLYWSWSAYNRRQSPNIFLFYDRGKIMYRLK